MKGQFTMRILATVFAVAMTATTAQAVELTPNLALNTEVVAEHQVDAETSTLVATPELAFTPGAIPGLELTAGVELNIWDNSSKFTLDNEFDVKPEILLGATFVPAMMDNLEIEAATSYNFETEARGEITLTATFNF